MTPTRSSTLFTVGGPVQAGDGVYLPRDADDQLLKLCTDRTYAYILSSRQVGKSSLMFRTARELRRRGIRAATVDLTGIGRIGIPADVWYCEVVQSIAERLDLPVDVHIWWKQHNQTSPVARFCAFFREVLFAEDHTPAVIFIDEIDSTLRLAYSDDFFAAIRSLQHDRVREPSLAGLTIVLLGVATPSELVRDVRLTPFNSAEPVILTDFSDAHLLPLMRDFPLAEPALAEIRRAVVDWTHGHPYLTQKLLRAVYEAGPACWNRNGVDEQVRLLFLGGKESDEVNLRSVSDTLLKRSGDLRYEVLDQYLSILNGDPCYDDDHSPVKNQLKVSGIVTRRQNKRLEVRNRIYEKVFHANWAKQARGTEVHRRILAALRRIATIILFISLPLAGGLVWLYAEWDGARQAADEQRLSAEQANKIAQASERLAKEARERAVLAEEAVKIEARKAEQASRMAASALARATQERTAAAKAAREANTAREEATRARDEATRQESAAKAERERAQGFAGKAKELEDIKASELERQRADARLAEEARVRQERQRLEEQKQLEDDISKSFAAAVLAGRAESLVAPAVFNPLVYRTSETARALLLAIESSRMVWSDRTDRILRLATAGRNYSAVRSIFTARTTISYFDFNRASARASSLPFEVLRGALPLRTDIRSTALAPGGWSGVVDTKGAARIFPPNRRGIEFRKPLATRFTRLAFDPAGQLVATLGTDETVRFWGFSGESANRKADASATGVLQWSQRGSFLAVSQKNNASQVRILNPFGNEFGKLPHDNNVTAIALSEASHRIVTAGHQMVPRVWNIQDTGGTPRYVFTEVHFFPDWRGAVFVTFDDTGSRFAIVDPRGAVGIFGEKSELLQRLDVPMPPERALFLPDRDFIAVQGTDGSVTIYHLPSNIAVSSFASRSALNIGLADDHRFLIFNRGTEDVVALPWNPKDVERQACEAAGRNLTRIEWAEAFPEEPYRKTCDEYPEAPEIAPGNSSAGK